MTWSTFPHKQKQKLSQQHRNFFRCFNTAHFQLPSCIFNALPQLNFPLLILYFLLFLLLYFQPSTSRCVSTPNQTSCASCSFAESIVNKHSEAPQILAADIYKHWGAYKVWDHGQASQHKLKHQLISSVQHRCSTCKAWNGSLIECLVRSCGQKWSHQLSINCVSLQTVRSQFNLSEISPTLPALIAGHW